MANRSQTWAKGLIGTAALLLTASTAAAQFTFLDTIEVSYTPTDVSADGSVVVGYSDKGYFAYPDLEVPEGFLDPVVRGQYFTQTAADDIVDIGGVAPGNSTGTVPHISHDGNRISGLAFNPNQLVPLGGAYGDQLVPVAEMSYYDRSSSQWINLGYGDLSSASIKTSSTARGISGNGQHVVGRAYIGGGGQRHTEVVVWTDDGSGQPTPGSIVELPIPDEVRDGVLVQPNAISDDGGTIVGTITSGQTFIWKDGALVGKFNSYNSPGAVSGDGNVVVGDNYRGTPGDFNGDYAVDHADYAVWRDNLGGPAGSIENNLVPGPIGVGAYQTWKENFGYDGGSTGGTYEAWRWTEEGGVEPLGCFSGECGVGRPTTKVRGYAVDANHDGSLIVGYETTNTPSLDTAVSWLWQEGVGQMDLKQYFIDQGLQLVGIDENFEFTLPSAMSADGRTFVGRGYDPDDIAAFGDVGWIVRLPPLTAVASTGAVPEPSTVALLIVGGVALVAARRRAK